MEKRYQLIRFLWLLPGIFTLLVVSFIIFISLFTLLFYSEKNDLCIFFQENNIFLLLKSSCLQAVLSTFISVILAIPLSKALYHSHIILHKNLIKLCHIILSLPVMVIVLGILSVYGRNGWLSKIFYFFNINYNFSIYGLYGVLITHVFFNLPLATVLLLQTLKTIPCEHLDLGAQLKIKKWNHFFLIEWPVLKKKLFQLYL